MMSRENCEYNGPISGFVIISAIIYPVFLYLNLAYLSSLKNSFNTPRLAVRWRFLKCFTSSFSIMIMVDWLLLNTTGSSNLKRLLLDSLDTTRHAQCSLTKPPPRLQLSLWLIYSAYDIRPWLLHVTTWWQYHCTIFCLGGLKWCIDICYQMQQPTLTQD